LPKKKTSLHLSLPGSTSSTICMSLVVMFPASGLVHEEPVGLLRKIHLVMITHKIRSRRTKAELPISIEFALEDDSLQIKDRKLPLHVCVFARMIFALKQKVIMLIIV